VLHSAQTTFRYNTGRVLIQIMKAIIRSRHDEAAQLKLIHDFRKAAAGNPRIVREILTRHHLMEMPEEWNQLTMDNHVHDANTKGRKNATFLIMDAWVKGIRHLTVVYYNYVEPAVARELLQAAAITGLSVRIGLEFRAVFRGRYVDFIWTPRGFSDTEDFLEFLVSPSMQSFMDEGRRASQWAQLHVMDTLTLWNERHAPALAHDLGIPTVTIAPEAFRAFAGNGQPSLLHLAEFTHKALLPELSEKIKGLSHKLNEADEETRAALLERIHALDELTPSCLHDRYLRSDRNPELPSPEDPPVSPDDTRPEILRLSVPGLHDRLTSLRSGYRITLQLAGLTAEDVLELLWDGQGMITHLELFNVKEWHDGNLSNLKEINELQLALNKGDVMHLKRMLRDMLRHFDCDGTPESQERCEKFRAILGNIPALQALYRFAPLASHMGTDSTSHLGNRYGMGLAVPETLPHNARKRLTGNRYISPVTLPIQVQLGYREEFRPTEVVPAFCAWMRRAFGLTRCGMLRQKERELIDENVQIAQPGNVITMGGITVEKSNGLTVENYPLLVFSIIALANGIYISSHNIYRGFPRTAVVGNFFRSVLAIPVAVLYNHILHALFPLITSLPPEQVLIPAAAIVSKFASDTVAGVIQSTADKRNNYRLRRWDYRTKLRHLFDCYTRLELAFPDRNMLALLAQPREFIRFTSREEARALQVESIINALDLMYFWYYQPCAQQTLLRTLKGMTSEERVVLARFQSILLNVQEICQLFVDGMLGANFSRALSFYLDNYEDYINTIARHCSIIDEKGK